MDLASLIGLIGALGMVLGAMISAGGLSPFIDVASVLIVLGGTFFAVMFKTPLPAFLGHFKAIAKAFMPKPASQEALVTQMVELSDLARKNGLMALENADIKDSFFAKGIQMLVDGADEAKMVKAMNDEIRAMKTRHNDVHEVLRGWIDIAPAMGMIGTLIGLVQMLGNMEDPKAIGPAMAVALLTTLYGAFFANILFGPLLAKLETYSTAEVAYRDMVIRGLRNVARGDSGRVVQDEMVAALPPKLQAKLRAA
ncbi:MAG: MotA/TolQ/ExbB proton channel family protein [Loktanella sp.]|nr:MotA/TolQ/ExbB proton channel family protein [Loktanella sp.]